MIDPAHIAVLMPDDHYFIVTFPGGELGLMCAGEETRHRKMVPPRSLYEMEDHAACIETHKWCSNVAT